MPDAAETPITTDLTPTGVERAIVCALSAEASGVRASARTVHTVANLWERRRGS